ncbi:MAG: 4-(cytidine 5'-diphospho)-2-C-methyl-D-erythritol kinase [Pseudolabrys sp.]
MPDALTERAPAKVNLTLRVLGRRADGYHRLESLVAFADLADGLSLVPGEGARLEVSGTFAAQCGAVNDNLVLRAAAAALAAATGELKQGEFKLTKSIPVAAGIGGGSSDAAAALRLLARANGIALDDRRLLQAASTVGADVPVCLDPRARVMRGVGEELSPPLDLPPLQALLVNPGVPLATRDVFGKFDQRDASSVALGEVPTGHDDFLDWLAEHGNDLTNAAAACVPVISDMLGLLAKLDGCRLARMSGSGATCFALFDEADAATAAATKLNKNRADWWVCTTTLR